MTIAYEVNFDGIVGPTHNYAGLSHGNIASSKHQQSTSSPKQAALEGLAKMKRLMDMGLKQAVLPPQERPDIAALRNLGFLGSDVDVLGQAHRADPTLLAAACSASSMWAANAATLSPSPDTTDHRLHITPANLISQYHRSIESPTTTTILRAIFADPTRFVHHDPLHASPHLGDEGAANHTRLCTDYHSPGIEVFVFGQAALDPAAPMPNKFPARQTRQASQAIARLHQLDPKHTAFIQQNPVAIDQGVFHNDVIAVGNRNTFLYHRDVFVDTPAAIDELRRKFADTCHSELACIEVSPQQLSIKDAVDTYLFNSQLISLPDADQALICPVECRDHPATAALLDQIIADDNPITAVHFVDVRQSMKNGGGPACLRLRVVLTDDELAHTHPGVLLTDQLYKSLCNWVQRHYRDHLTPDDLVDPKLLTESRDALDQLTQILGLGSIYPFQR